MRPRLNFLVSFGLMLSLPFGTWRCSRLERWCQGGTAIVPPCELLSPAGIVAVRCDGLTVPRISLVLGVDHCPVFSEGDGFTAGTVLVAAGHKLSPEQHPVVAQGIADDEPPVSEAEHQGE